MTSSVLNYIFNITGNFQVQLNNFSQTITQVNENTEKMSSNFDKVIQKVTKWNVAFEYVDRFASSIGNISTPFVELDKSLQDLSAITGVTGQALKEIEGYARDTAKTFGIEASGAVESYKLLLSQLSPELAKQPKALAEMGRHVAVLSKLMGGDAKSATEVLTTAMNQYGVDLSNPIEASRKMAEMMNVMAAAGKDGSSELPTIKQAIEQAGMASKSAGVAFSEMNGAIQVLDKAGKKGSEGGVALRNVLATLSQGRFLPKDVLQELQKAGISVDALTDKNRTLSERLTLLKPLLNDSALMTKFFGKENANAGMALIQGADEVKRYTEAITGTNNAQEQAKVIMESYAEKQARIKAQFEDWKISIGNALGSFGIWTTTMVESAQPIIGLIPALIPLAKVFWLAGVSALSYAKNVFASAIPATVAFTRKSWGLMTSLLKVSAVALWNGIKALAYYVASLVTGGASSIAFGLQSSIAFSTFSTSATSACAIVSTAIHSIPIIGWIALAVTAIAGLSTYLWNKSVKFRATIKGLWAYVKTTFMGLWDLTKTVFGAIGELIMSAFRLDGKGISNAIAKMKGAFVELGKASADAFQEAYDKEIADSEAKDKAKKKATDPLAELNISQTNLKGGGGNFIPRPKPSTGAVTSSSGASGTGQSPPKSINITIDKLVGQLTVQTTNLKEGTAEIKALVAEALLSAVNDVQLA